MLSYILAVVASVIAIAADRITKIYISSGMTLGQEAPLIPNVLKLCYVHNSGGAWGILAGYTWVLLTITAVIMIIGITVLVCKGLKNKWLFWSICLILSGGLGNMYDRIFNSGRVVDFLQFDFWQTFPVFNIADCAIVAGSAVLIIYFILDAIEDAKRKGKANDGK